jgi:conjugative transfer region lipoprotein (TIGR03751 family)
MNPARLLILIAPALLLPGCFGGGKDAILPQGGPSMKEVYDGHFAKVRQHNSEGARQAAGGRSPGTGEVDLAGWTREANTEIEQIFPRLPNPDLLMYVFPHLSREGHPVPGYATSFPMYEHVEYALPGEAEGR